MSFKAVPSNRGAFHNLMKKGKTPKEIADVYGVTEFAVVATLKHSSPYIEGASYDDLEWPIEGERLREAFEENKLGALSDELGVSARLLRARLRDMGVIGSKKKKKPTSQEPTSQESTSQELTSQKAKKLVLFYELLLKESASGGITAESASKIAKLFYELL